MRTTLHIVLRHPPCPTFLPNGQSLLRPSPPDLSYLSAQWTKLTATLPTHPVLPFCPMDKAYCDPPHPTCPTFLPNGQSLLRPSPPDLSYLSAQWTKLTATLPTRPVVFSELRAPSLSPHDLRLSHGRLAMRLFLVTGHFDLDAPIFSHWLISGGLYKTDSVLEVSIRQTQFWRSLQDRLSSGGLYKTGSVLEVSTRQTQFWRSLQDRLSSGGLYKTGSVLEVSTRQAQFWRSLQDRLSSGVSTRQTRDKTSLT
ncbi:hypothetical protein EGW08_007699 [Elysia chlorotica]|uniref:Uncharacterized protein n=1 Tax=Elysia chlorotica TaxID=188477 RepID=A0A3S1C6T7_ELYCH|nr:hypothetical protein EGW08_007699 [Elysia chlorotica]